jgi:hypothetical protein
VVDDFADLTCGMIRGAYVEALYRADEWEFERLHTQFWVDLITTVSNRQDNAYLFEKFPLSTGKNTLL